MAPYRNIILPASILAGTIIGAGVFSLPFVFARTGWLLGAGLLCLTTFVVYFLYILYADVIVRTPGDHRFVGYAKEYLGDKSFWLTVFMAVVEMIFALTIYIILGVSFFQLFTAMPAVGALIIFWGVGSFFIFLNIRRMAVAEFLINVGIILIIGAIFLFGLPKLDLADYLKFDFSKLLIPLGPILFALAGRPAIEEMRPYFKEASVPISFMKSAIFWGTILPAIVYFVFVMGVLGLSYGSVSEDAVSGLVNTIPYWLLVGIGILGLLSLWSSYILIGLNVKEILSLDLRLSRRIAAFLVVGFPLALYLVGFTGFIALVSFVGGLFLSLEGILIILMWLRMNKASAAPPVFVKRPHFVTIILILFLLMVVLGNELLNFSIDLWQK